MGGCCGGGWREDDPVGTEVGEEGGGEGDQDGERGEAAVFGVPVVVGAVEDVGFGEGGEGEAGWELLFGWWWWWGGYGGGGSVGRRS